MRTIVAPALILAASCSAPPATPVVAPKPPAVASTHTEAASKPIAPPTSERAPVHPDDPILGPRDAPVTILAFLDFASLESYESAEVLREIHKRYPDKVRIVFKAEPQADSEVSRDAAVLAHVAHIEKGEDAFWKTFDALFTKKGILSREVLDAVAKDAGIDAATLTRHREAGSARIARAHVDGGPVGISFAPSLVVDGSFPTTFYTPELLARVIEDHLLEVSALLATGTSREALYDRMVARNFSRYPDGAKVEVPATVYRVDVSDAASRGPADAPVTLVGFVNFNDVFLPKYGRTLELIEKAYAGKLRLVLKPAGRWVDTYAFHAASILYEARARKGDAGFFQAYTAILSRGSGLVDEHAIAKQLDIPEIANATSSPAHRLRFEADLEQGDDVDAHNLPATFVNGRRIDFDRHYGVYARVIDEELAKAEAKIAAGVPRAEVYAQTIKGGKFAERFELPIPKDAPLRGPKTAKVVVHVFCAVDNGCRHLLRAGGNDPVVGSLVDAAAPHGTKVAIVYRDDVSASRYGARREAILLRVIHKQKGDAVFWKALADVLDATSLDEASLQKIAKKHGVAWNSVADAIKAKTRDAVIEADGKAQPNPSPGSLPPIVFVNGRPLEELTAPSLKHALARALKE